MGQLPCINQKTNLVQGILFLLLIVLLLWFMKVNHFQGVFYSKITHMKQLKLPLFCPRIKNGQNELKQILKLKRRYASKLHFSNSTLMIIHKVQQSKRILKNYSYNVTEKTGVNNLNHVDRRFEFLIQEYYEGELTKGGTSFRVTVQSNYTIEMCGIEDHFDGTYSVCCNVREKCANVVAYALFVNFQAYNQQSGNYANKKQIIGQVVCTKESKMLKYTNNSIQNKEHVFVLNNENGLLYINRTIGNLWIKINNTWIWTENGHTFPKPKRSDLENCMKDLMTLTLIGDSHMVCSLHYILKLMGKLRPGSPLWVQKSGDIHTGKVHMYFIDYAKALNVLIENYPGMHNWTHTQKDIIVIGIGSWDLEYNLIETYLYWMQYFFKTFQGFRNNPQFKDAQYYWLGVPTVGKEESRNNYNMAAINRFVLDRITQLGVQVIDVR